MLNTLTVMLVSAVAASTAKDGEFMSAEAQEAARFRDLSEGARETVTVDERFGAHDGGDDDFEITSEELVAANPIKNLSWFN